MSGTTPVVARAPGRVNLIGEHTDYTGGFVLPVAIEESVVISATPRPDGVVRLRSKAYGDSVTFPAPPEPQRVLPAWAPYPAAVLAMLLENGLPVIGFDATISSDLPIGGGLASSAALTVATALAARGAARASGAELPGPLDDRAFLARLCRDAEAAATGVRCGLMDPWCCLHAEEGAALLLDCREETFDRVAIDDDHIAFVIADSGVRHELAASEYNRRRSEVEEAIRLLPGVESPRDLAPADLSDRVRDLPEPLSRRLGHVVTENARTLAAVAALRAGDAEEFGRLLDESHESLAHDYDVSGPELEELVGTLRRQPGVLGCRLTGGGFGGFAVAAVLPAAAKGLVASLDGRFPARVVVPSGAAWAATVRRKET